MKSGVLVVGGFYKNSAGQVRKILAMDDENVQFFVVVSGAGHPHWIDRRGKGTCLKPETVKTVKRRSFLGWAMIRCRWDGQPYPTDAPPRATRPRVGDMGPAIREFFRVAEGRDAINLCPDE